MNTGKEMPVIWDDYRENLTFITIIYELAGFPKII
jgi:hypothetical protein